MRDFIRHLLIAETIVLCMSFPFTNGNLSSAQEINGQTVHWIWPTDGEITDTYGTRKGTHKGIDIAAEPRTPVYAVDGGVVSKSYYSDTYGHVIFIKHQNNLETVYAHLNIRKVSEGQTVQQGDLIGKMGNTGDSSGVHLHFEVHENEWTYSKENAIDPDKALGFAEIGQVVYAQSQAYAEGSIETAGHPHSEKTFPKNVTGQLMQTIHTESSGETHIVQSGETLWSISQMYNIRVEWLAEINQLSQDQIVIGQELNVGQKDEIRYMVIQGDTLINISKKTGASVDELKKKNHLVDDKIYPEQVLIVE